MGVSLTPLLFIVLGAGTWNKGLGKYTNVSQIYMISIYVYMCVCACMRPGFHVVSTFATNIYYKCMVNIVDFISIIKYH